MKTTTTVTLDQAEVVEAVDQYLQRKHKMQIDGEISIAGSIDKQSGPVTGLGIRCQVSPKKRKEKA